MRFSVTHKLSSYLMIACAFIPLALSGELSPGIVVFTVVTGVASWFFEPSRQRITRTRAWPIAWNVLTLGVLARAILDWLRGGTPLVVAGVYFLCFLLVNKLLNRRSSKDYLQSYVVSFLMLVAGTTLNTGLVYAVAYLFYVVFATWTLTMFHLRREMEENYLLKHSDDGSERVEVERILNSRRVVGGPFLAGTALVAVGVFVGSSSVFLAVPRIPLNRLFGPSRGGVMTTGFADRIELGHYGLIKDNPQVVARVEFPNGRPDEPLHFRGVAFDTYDHGRWSRAETGRMLLKRTAGVWQVPQRDDDDDPSRAVTDGALRQDVYLEPLDTPVLFGASQPVGFAMTPPRPEETSRIELGASGEVYGITLDEGKHPVPVATGRRYTVWSRVQPVGAVAASAHPAESLSTAERQFLHRYLQLPDDLPPRVRELAKRITDGKHTPFEKADAVATWLRRNYRYTQDLRRDEKYEPLDDFLFVEKAGHCEYFASAMAILLRAVDVPTRSVNGFYAGEWNGYGHYLALRQGDAHSWVEVWLGGDVGWATFDPTPAIPVPPDDPSWSDRARQLVDTLELAWFKWVIEYDLGKQIDVFRALGDVFRSRRGHGGAGHRHGHGFKAWASDHRRDLYGGGAALLVAALVWLNRRRRILPSLGRPKGPPLRATRALDRALRALERRQLARRDPETMQEFARRVAAASDAASAPFATLVERYYEARFGGLEVDAAEVERLADQVVAVEKRA